AAFHKSWPKLSDDAGWSVPAVFFDMWRQEHPTLELEPVPADMVMASGSGLDPHITLKNALYQARRRVAGAWADKLLKERKLSADAARRKGIEEKVHQEIVRLLNERASAPLGGLAGVPLVNVLEVNLALRERVGRALEGK